MIGWAGLTSVLDHRLAQVCVVPEEVGELDSPLWPPSIGYHLADLDFHVYGGGEGAL